MNDYKKINEYKKEIDRLNNIINQMESRAGADTQLTYINRLKKEC